jgi:hypothetical protein
MKTIEKQDLFWDVNLVELDEKKHREFIAKRILTAGNSDDLKWALDCYGTEVVKNIFLQNCEEMDRKSKNFWFLYFNLDKNQCQQMPSTTKQSLFLKR